MGISFSERQIPAFKRSKDHQNTIQCDKVSKKNSVDLKLTVDIMTSLYTNDHIDVFIIISTDSDFRHVIYEIKAKNKKTVVIGYDFANVSLKSICNQYIDLTKTKDLLENIPIDDSVSRWCKNFSKNSNILSDTKTIDDKYAKYVKEFLNIYKSSTIGKINNVLSNIEPNFDYRIYGFSRISDFLKYILSDDNNILIEGNDIIMLEKTLHE